jgi:pilus assembly protein CpaE
MGETLNVLCLTNDHAIAQTIVAGLGQLPDFAIETRIAEYEEGLHDLREPELAVVVLGADPTLGLVVIEEVHRASPATQVLAVSPDENPETIIKAMRAGADEHLSLPVTLPALLKVCIKVSELRRVTGPRHGAGELWVAYSPKGGVGVTTLVANLALAVRDAGRDTALVDLDVYAGDLALFLNVTPTYTLRDVVTNFKRLDSVFLHGSMIRHPSGVQLLAAPAGSPGDPPVHLGRDQTIALLELLSTAHDVTLVDTPGIPTDATRAALSCADRILLVTELSVPSLRGCLRTLDWLRDERIDPAEVVEVVVNKVADRACEISPAEAARTLGLPLRALLPRDDVAAWTASNTGMPLSEVRGGTTLQRAIAGLATRTAVVEEPTRKRMGFLRLFSGAERRA